MAVPSGTLGSWPSESSLWREFSIDASGAGAGGEAESSEALVGRLKTLVLPQVHPGVLTRALRAIETPDAARRAPGGLSRREVRDDAARRREGTGGSRHGLLAQGNENLAACSLDGCPCHGARARLPANHPTLVG